MTTPRKIVNVNDGEVKTVYGFAITRNMWEYFFLDNDKGNPYRFALVQGFETEMGDVSMGEINPYIYDYTENLTEVLPPIGWRWAD